MYKRFHVNYPLFLSDFIETFNFLDGVSKKYSTFKFHKNPSIGSEFHGDGRTDMMKLIVAFCNFAKAPKIYNKNAEGSCKA
jgi:hypothetical protein